ncbi:enoyl-CoA hydratase [Solicola gregarius]|uniref:Enoyl-CoA hydratase n=1 Tax=Solicola gregarius TaxID=2908642 RepID=A0AA46TID4_9ACTN|nr:enoyl-CoA hydratase [Solicola gregarius]UYM05815.1 enoyl-CoA hydratase [Solicola gregarius]
MTDELIVEADGAALRVTFNRPHARNAMTHAMYDGLVAACDRADADDAIRVLVLRGAGGAAFVAGTDIAQFDGFDGAQGVAYERSIDATVGRLLRVDVPVVAAVDGPCVGGGLAIAAAADVRIAGTDARFGVPIARTLGNTLSAATLALLERQLGHARTVDMLISARFVDAAEAQACGFVREVAADVTAAADDMVERLLGHAPLTLWSIKETLRRLHADAGEVDASDVIGAVYGSADFAEGVAAFADKRQPRWSGR